MNLCKELPTDLEKLLNSVDQSSKLTAAYHYLYEREMSPEDTAYILERLFPRKKRPAYRIPNEQLVDAQFLESFFSFRALGLTLPDTAALLGVTEARLNELLLGHELSAEKHSELLKRDLRSQAVYKHGLVSVVAQAAHGGDWKAALALLERRYPGEYGRKDQLNQTLAVSGALNMEECETRAAYASARLRELRDARAVESGEKVLGSDDV